MEPLPNQFIDLSGRKVIVSGAGGGGIGTAATTAIARAGGTVIAVDRSLERLTAHLETPISGGLKIVPTVADVTTESGVTKVMDAAEKAPGVLYGLVTVVGGAPPPTWGPATALSREHWRSQIALNLDSMFFMTQAVASRLRADGLAGSLVAISSINGLTSSPYNVGYGAGKAAIQSVVQTLAVELARDGIRVNAVAPGPVATPTANLSGDPDRLRRGIPMGRYGTPEEIAGPVLFLLSELAGYMTGQCLIADGGCNVKWCHLTDDNMPMFLKSDSVREAMKNASLTGRSENE